GQSLEKPQGFTIIINQKPVTQNPVAEAPQNNHSSYHGPTSVLFEEIPRLQGGNNAEERFSEDTEQARYRLVAESARQRQLEYVNVSTGRLDFDGVEPELGMQLLSIFWTRQPHAGLIVYRTAFMRDMACGGPYFSRLLLNAMYYAASKHSPAKMIRQNAADRATSGWSFRQRFDELLRASFDKTHITTIQALLIMASSLFTRCGERSISWLYAGNAFNMIIDSGIHVESPTSKTMASEDLEIRRRVYWGAFMIDKIQCLYQGRHPCLRMSDTNVPLVFIDDYEELELFPGASFCDPAQPSTSPSYHITTLKSLCRLSIVMERIHNKIYAVSHLTQTSENLCKEALDLQLELEAWRQCLPTHLDFITYKTKMSPLPYNLSMLAVYNVLVILVHRLLLSDVSLSAGSIASQALATCWKAASEITHILRVHEKLYKPLSETFSLCYAAYIGATVLIHMIVRHGDQFGAVEALRICLNCLSKHQAFYSAAKRASSIIAKLMERAAVHICECGGLSGQCQLQHSAYMNAVSPNSNQVLPGGIGSDGHAANGSPNSHLIALPNLESLEFDVDLAFQDFRRLQETTDSRLGMVEYPMLYDLYHNSPQENAVESTKQAATM
ncbi:fungal specific transcription factor domain-containing protein, partial [Colletotrichum truncatum]